MPVKSQNMTKYALKAKIKWPFRVLTLKTKKLNFFLNLCYKISKSASNIAFHSSVAMKL